MHDPYTLAFSIKSPIRKTLDNGYKYHSHLIDIWHKDPERDGSDDSCGWSWPHFTKKQQSTLKFFAKQEAKHPWFCKRFLKANEDAVECEALLRGAFLLVAPALNCRFSLEQATLWAAQYTHNQVDNFRSSLAFLPGYHSNFETDDPLYREERATQFFFAIARIILRENRRWYQHPRFHIHHWRIDLVFWKELKRRLSQRKESASHAQ